MFKEYNQLNEEDKIKLYEIVKGLTLWLENCPYQSYGFETMLHRYLCTGDKYFIKKLEDISKEMR